MFHSLSVSEISQMMPMALPVEVHPLSFLARPKYSRDLKLARWVFKGQYRPCLGISYVVINKGFEKLLPQLHYIKMNRYLL